MESLSNIDFIKALKLRQITMAVLATIQFFALILSEEFDAAVLPPTVINMQLQAKLGLILTSIVGVSNSIYTLPVRVSSNPAAIELPYSVSILPSLLSFCVIETNIDYSTAPRTSTTEGSPFSKRCSRASGK